MSLVSGVITGPIGLTKSVLEALTIIAYKQPTTKSKIEHIRGVSADYAISKLIEYDLIESNERSDLPGKPRLYVTTNAFLELFDLNSLDELPKELDDFEEKTSEVTLFVYDSDNEKNEDNKEDKVYDSNEENIVEANDIEEDNNEEIDTLNENQDDDSNEENIVEEDNIVEDNNEETNTSNENQDDVSNEENIVEEYDNIVEDNNEENINEINSDIEKEDNE